MFTEEILMMMFEELGYDFEEWAAVNDYANMSDQAIYAALPADIQAACGDFGLNASWMHGGL